MPRSVIYTLRLIQDLKRQPTICFTAEDTMRVIFPSSSQLVDNFIHLVYFLHHEGVKLRPKVARTYSSLRSNSFAEVGSQISHVDEALFGNLFSEGSPSLCSMEPNDKPPVAVNNNLPLQAAKELLNFRRTCIFFQEWVPSIYEDGCKKIDTCHIDILLSVVGCSIEACSKMKENPGMLPLSCY